MQPKHKALCAVLTAFSLSAVSARAALVTFDNGNEGWDGPQGPGGSTFIDAAFGNPAPSLHTVFNDFGITFSTATNADFVGDYTQAPAVTLGLDVNTLFLNFFGQDVTRDFMVELRDYDNPPAGYPWVSVWYVLGTLDAADTGWHSWSVTIGDTSATGLPPGWGGYGAEDPDTFEPILPADRTFTSVLAGVDELAFGTLIPGFFFGFTDHDVVVDNIGIQFVPEPATAGWVALGAIAVLRRRPS